jgi:hypothetical protein
MAEAAHLQLDGKAIYAWYYHKDKDFCKYLLVDGRDVYVSFVTRSTLDLGYPLGTICLGEAVYCTMSMMGHLQPMPPEVAKWLTDRNIKPLIVQVGEAMIVRREGPCAQCQRKNDIGTAKCWWCATPYPTGI